MTMDVCPVHQLNAGRFIFLLLQIRNSLIYATWYPAYTTSIQSPWIFWGSFLNPPLYMVSPTSPLLRYEAFVILYADSLQHFQEGFWQRIFIVNILLKITHFDSCLILKMMRYFYLLWVWHFPKKMGENDQNTNTLRNFSSYKIRF